MGNRVIWIDWLKTISITAMMIGHFWAPAMVRTLIYAFHMPALLFISGYLYKPNILKRSILSLVIPVVFVSILIALIDYFTGKNVNAILQDFDVWNYRFTGIWFIETLISFRIFFNFSWTRNHKVHFAILSFILISIYDYLGICTDFDLPKIRFFSCLPFFVCGMCLKEHKYKLGIKKGMLCFLTILAIVVALIQGKCDIYGLEYSKLGYPLFFAESLFCVFCFIMWLKNIRRNQFVETISNGTILILGLHEVLFSFLIKIFPGKFFAFQWLINALFLLAFFYFLITFSMKYCPILIGKLKRF